MVRMIAILFVFLSGCSITGRVYYEKDCKQFGKTGSEINWTMGQNKVN